MNTSLNERINNAGVFVAFQLDRDMSFAGLFLFSGASSAEVMVVSGRKSAYN